MADIRNDQYLHRPGAGRGAITPADPFEVLLHSGGQPISGTNRLPVEATLSGSLETELFPRAVRRGTASSPLLSLRPHPGIKGVRIAAIVSGMTGSFASDEGWMLRVLTTSSGDTAMPLRRILDIQTSRYTQNGVAVVTIYPGAVPIEEHLSFAFREEIAIPTPASGNFRAILDIQGTFADGEGIDSEVIVHWLY